MTRKLKNIELNRLTTEEFKSTGKRPLAVVLDNIRSLHNVGAVFRTSDAFLVEKIYLCGITGTPPHKDIFKSALGAEETVDWEHRPTTAECLQLLQETGYHILGVEQTDNSAMLGHDALPAAEKYAIVLGNEVEGIGEAALPYCNSFIEIPQGGTKHSLNVSVAAGIVLWELAKKIPVL